MAYGQFTIEIINFNYTGSVLLLLNKYNMKLIDFISHICALELSTPIYSCLIIQLLAEHTTWINNRKWKPGNRRVFMALSARHIRFAIIIGHHFWENNAKSVICWRSAKQIAQMKGFLSIFFDPPSMYICTADSSIIIYSGCLNIYPLIFNHSHNL